MVSSLTQQGAMITFEAMELLGVFDYVPNPGVTVSLNIKEVSQEIVSKVKQVAKMGAINRIKKRMSKVEDQQIVVCFPKIPSFPSK
jgi:two-component system chemotaxis response regulator CheB